MRFFFTFLTLLSIISCNEQEQLDYYDIKIGFENDTIYEFQPLRHYYQYSNLIDLNQTDKFVKAEVNSSFGSFDILKNFERDSISFRTFVFTSCADIGIVDPSKFIEWRELEYQLSLTTKNGIDTAFNHKKRFYFDCSLNSPIAEGQLKNNKRIGRWIFYKTIKKKTIRAISYYNPDGLKDGIDTIFHDYPKNSIDEITTYENGQKNGLTKSFSWTTGQVITVGQYKDGHENGKWINISFTGIINIITEFDMGKELSKQEVYWKKIPYNEKKNAL